MAGNLIRNEFFQICLDELFQTCSHAYVLYCGHCFHPLYIRQWLREPSTEYPICGIDVRASFIEAGELDLIRELVRTNSANNDVVIDFPETGQEPPKSDPEDDDSTPMKTIE